MLKQDAAKDERIGKRVENMGPKALVEAFYADVWNRRDHQIARDIIAQDFRFRGSLGPEKRGVYGFLEYVEAVHTALGDYTCEIRDLIATEDRVAAQMFFHGVHRAEFFGVPATGRTIAWAGAAFFTVHESKLTALWVLGDIDAVKAQLNAEGGSSF